MTVYRLKPRAHLLDDQDWQPIPYRGECWVMAGDETEARGEVSGRYAHARPPRAHCPWLQPRLVEVERFEIAPVGGGSLGEAAT